MKRAIFFISIFITFLIALNCSPYKMKAIRAQRDHRYELAVQYALKHIASHPNDKSAITILDKSAAGYFQELEKEINHFEKLNDWNKIVRIADNGFRNLSKVADVYGTHFPTKKELDYLQEKREQSKMKQAEELYSQAILLYQNNDYEEALNKFKECQSYISHFKDCDKYVEDINGKLAQKYYQSAEQLLSRGETEAALQQFEKVVDFYPDFLDVNQKIAEIKTQLAESYYNKGRKLYDDGEYKTALKELEKALNYQADHAEASDLYQDIKNKLTVRLAIFPFKTVRLDKKFGKLVSDQVLTRALHRKNEFIQFLDRENLQKIFEEQALSQTGVIDEKTAVEVGKMSGVNTIAIGTVTLVSSQVTGPTKRSLTGHFEKTYRDAKGVERKKRVPFNYTEYEKRREVEVKLSYRLISVETGEILFSETLSSRKSDAATWISCRKEFVSKLSASERKKLRASKEPESTETLISQAVDSLTDRAAKRIIEKISPF